MTLEATWPLSDLALTAASCSMLKPCSCTSAAFRELQWFLFSSVFGMACAQKWPRLQLKNAPTELL